MQIFNSSVAQFLTQIVDFPIRFLNKFDQHASLVDIFLTSSHIFYRASQCHFVNSDHSVVSVDISFELNFSVFFMEKYVPTVNIFTIINTHSQYLQNKHLI